MKLALIRASSSLVNDILVDEHLGLAYLAATLDRNGIAVSRVFEEPAYNATGLSLETEVKQFSPDVLAFTIDYTNIHRTVSLQEHLRSILGRCGDAPIRVWGGHHASLCAKQIIEQDLADYVVPGNAEESFGELVRHLARGHRPPQRVFLSTNHQYWLDEDDHSRLSVKLPIRPRRDTLEILTRKNQVKAARVLTSRGCPFSCVFCTTPALRRLKLIPRRTIRPPEDVVHEMEELHEQWGIRTFYINDDIFIDGSITSKTRALKLADLLLRRELNISFKTQLRVDSLTPGMDDNLLFRLRAAGMGRVFLGIESAVDRVLQELGKRASAADNLQAMRWYETAGVHVTPGRILFTPETTWDDLHETISFFFMCQKSLYLLRRPNFRLVVFPGTDVYHRLTETGRIKPGNHLFEVDYVFDNPYILSFCRSLEAFFPRFIRVVQPIFRILAEEFLLDRNERPPQADVCLIRSRCEEATKEFLLTNIEMGNLWKRSAFEETATAYLHRLRHITQKMLGINSGICCWNELDKTRGLTECLATQNR